MRIGLLLVNEAGDFHSRPPVTMNTSTEAPVFTVQFVHLPTRPDVLTQLIVNCVVGFVVLVIISSRLAARFVLGAGIWWDDALILFALVGFP